MPDPDTMTLDECRAYVGHALNMPGDPPATIDGAIAVIEGFAQDWARTSFGWSAYTGPRYSDKETVRKHTHVVQATSNHTLDAWRLAAKVVMAFQT